MTHVEFFIHFCLVPLSICDHKSRDFRIPIYGDQVMPKITFDAIIISYFLKRGLEKKGTPNITRPALQNCNIDIVPSPCFDETISRQIHNFLRISCTFDRHWRLCKKAVPVFNPLDAFPSVFGGLMGNNCYTLRFSPRVSLALLLRPNPIVTPGKLPNSRNAIHPHCAKQRSCFLGLKISAMVFDLDDRRIDQISFIFRSLFWVYTSLQ